MSDRAEKRLFVSIDADMCGGGGNCVECAPAVFTLVDGLSHVKIDGIVIPSAHEAIVPIEEEAAVIKAAEECPGEIIMLEPRALQPPAV